MQTCINPSYKNDDHKRIMRKIYVYNNMKVFRRIYYRRNTMEMPSLQKYEVSYSETKRFLRFCI